MATQRDKSGLVAQITSVVTTNGNQEFTAAILNELLDDFTESLIFNNGSSSIDDVIISDTFSASSGTDNAITLNITASQSSTASYVGLDIDVTESSVGSGTQQVIRLQKDSSEVFSVYSAGFVDMVEQSAPGTPSTGYGRLYWKTDGKLYAKNDGGTEYDLTAAAVGTGASISGTPAVNQIATFTNSTTITGSAELTYDGSELLVSNATGTNIEIQAATSGDVFVHFDNNTVDWSIGVDDTDSDKFVISNAGTLGTGNAITITTAEVVDIVTGLKIGSSTVTANDILDEDTMITNSATALATQQSIKAYVDSQVAAAGGGNVLSSGTPANTQLAIWTGSSAIQGSSNLTYGSGTLTLSGSSGDITALVSNTSTTATDDSIVKLVTASSGGDPQIYFNISATTDWSVGIDNSDSDKFVIANGSALGTGNAITITTGEHVDLVTSFTVASGQTISEISTDGTLASNVDTALVTEKAIKTYVDTTVAAAGGGNVSNTGTPANNQLAVWTSSTIIEGDSDLTWDQSTLYVHNSAANTKLKIEAGGTTDPYVLWTATGIDDWSIGIDASTELFTLSSSDGFSGNLIMKAAAAGNVDFVTSLSIAGGTAITGFIDDDTMATASATNIASAESVKAYVDTEVASSSGNLKRVSVSVSSAELLAINSTPKTLIAAQGVDQVIILHRAYCEYTYGTTTYAGDTTLVIEYGGTAYKLSSDAFNINATSSRYAIYSSVNISNSVDDLANKAAILTTASSDPTTGDGTFKIWLEYTVIDVS